ncbi:MAG: cytochrome c biogenesis protein ResB [Pseudobdellovibrionaceae bacterium]
MNLLKKWMSSLQKIWFSIEFNLAVVVMYAFFTILIALCNIETVRNSVFSFWPRLPEILDWFYLNAWLLMLLILAFVNLMAIGFERSPTFKARARKVIKLFASLKLAVIIILALAIVSSVGTIVESMYRLEAAQKWVYQTPWMYSVLGALCVTLLAVMLDRLPWNKNHIPFICAHIGIILLILGALETQKKGVDGSMRIEIGQKNRYITIPDTEITVYSSFDGNSYTQMFRKEVDFFKVPPQKELVSFPVGTGEVRFTDFSPFALGSKKVVASESPQSGEGLRFVLTMANAEVSEWIVQRRPGTPANFEVGPANVILGPAPEARAENEIYIQIPENGVIDYKLFYRDSSKKPLNGKLKEGEVLTTGWGGVQFKPLKALKQAEETWEFKDLERPTDITNAVATFDFKGKEYRLQLNDMIKLFTDEAVYIVTYGNKRLDSGVEVNLDRFEIGRYQGTMRAAAYQSWVSVPGLGSQEISMNEPMKHNGYTFYQASFQEDESGRPTASVLSVNKDPARVEKYLGSLLIVLGSALLFYRRKMRKVDLAKIS